MQKYLSLAALAAVAVVGCNKSPEGGTPTTGTTHNAPPAAGGTFKLSAPSGTTSIKQGNSDTVTVTVDRSSGFKQSVKLTAAAPDKVKVDFSKDPVAASDPADEKMTITVAKDAPLGDASIRVTGTPEAGGTAVFVDVKIKVEKP